MKPYIEPIHIKKYAGKRVDGEKKLRYIDYFMHRINLLRHHKITPVVVFDGGNVPCKSTTEQDRHRRRISNREIAMAKLKEGNVSAATEFFQENTQENGGSEFLAYNFEGPEEANHQSPQRILLDDQY
uniref:Exonuclease 1 n=1 Tax=Cannabis sativa TaxID=3483 RepID=A0A803PAM9_CANSA